MSALHRPIALLLAAAAPLGVAFAQDDGFTDRFPIAACNFDSQGNNPFFRLVVNRQLYLSNVRCVGAGDCDELEELWITVLPETRDIKFSHEGRQITVRTRVVEEYETADGELEEVSRNFFAQCKPMNDVYYLGEDVFDGDGHKLPDAWLSGKSGARPGIIMPDQAFLLGSRYYQEIAPNAQDRGEHTSMGFEVEVPAGVFQNCVEITETSPLEPGHESLKTYCPNIGLVRDGDLELVAVFSNAESPSEND
jgi:hypothetical protein